jgi:hypothetical protein
VQTYEFHNKEVYELHLELHIMGLIEALSEAEKLSTLILTIPAISPYSERSFSALPRIHTFVRNTQGQA